MNSNLLSSAIKPIGAIVSFVVVVIIIFVIWKIASYMWAELSGWNAIAKLYPDRPNIPATSIKQRVMFVTKNNYKLNYIFDLESTVEGLRFRSRQTLVKTFDSALIPWSDLQGPQNNSPLGYLAPSVIFSAAKVPDVRLKFTNYIADWLKQESVRYQK